MTGPGIQVGADLVAEGLTAPVGLVSPDDRTGRLFVVDQIGVIRIIDENGTLSDKPFLDLRENIVEIQEDLDERGLLGLAFHPDFEENGRFFVYYSGPLAEGAPEGWNHTSYISEFNVSGDDPNIADPDSERVILEVDQPQFNNNGGTITFGPDGYLYISLGDGGGEGDTGIGHPPDGNGQNTTTLLGSILRIDTDGEEPYGIPDDNPFARNGTDNGAAGDAREEIYAYGLRNPWRIAFDSEGENHLFAGDAGQGLWEAVYSIEPGNNYGWNIREGSHCFDPKTPKESPEQCPDNGSRGEPLIDPIIEYQNAKQSEEGIGEVMVGGNVYRGSAIPALEGMYVFATWNRPVTGEDVATGGGVLFAATMPEENATGEMWDFEELTVIRNETDNSDNETIEQDSTIGAYVISFGQDAENELYVLTTDNRGPIGETGKIYKLVPAPDDAAT